MSSLDCFWYVIKKLILNSLPNILYTPLMPEGCQRIDKEQAKMTIVTHTSASPDWITRHSSHRVWIRDIKLYIFCKNYTQSHQTRRGGLFEIRFIEEDGTHRF
jgi:hypothetical protein